jgi:S-methylmethionine-dependent homocysteine/selenocysteine methylase
MRDLKEILKKRDSPPLLLDGAMGTELKRKGASIGMPLWSAEALIDMPNLVTEVHESYIRAGADIITTNTFRTQESVLEKVEVGYKSAFYTKLACSCALKAIDKTDARDVFIAGSMAPLEECYDPDAMLDEETMRKTHGKHAKALVSGGVDFILIETMNNIDEARIALKAARRYTKDVMISFVCRDRELLSGERLSEAVESIRRLKPTAILLNCAPAEITTENLRFLKELTEIPIGAYANGKAVMGSLWDHSKGYSISEFASFAKKWIDHGARVVGGCCGTGPEHTAEMRRMIDDMKCD